VARFTNNCFMITRTSYVAVANSLKTGHGPAASEENGPRVQIRVKKAVENRDQDRQARPRQAGGGVLRSPRTTAGELTMRDREGDALQARAAASFAPEIYRDPLSYPVPRRRIRQGARHRRRAGRQASHSMSSTKQVGCRQPGRGKSSNGSRVRAAYRSADGLPARAAGLGRKNNVGSSRRGGRPDSPHRGRFRLRTRMASNPTLICTPRHRRRAARSAVKRQR